MGIIVCGFASLEGDLAVEDKNRSPIIALRQINDFSNKASILRYVKASFWNQTKSRASIISCHNSSYISNSFTINPVPRSNTFISLVPYSQNVAKIVQGDK